MAHITEIKIEGLLGRIEPIQITLNRDVNIFFGENGCGKTTLLKVLDAALSGDGAAMELLPVTKATVDIYSNDEDKMYRHTWERRAPESQDELTRLQIELLDREYLISDDLFSSRQVISQSEWLLTPYRRRGKVRSLWPHSFLPTTRLYFGQSHLSRPSAQPTRLSEKELDRVFSESVNRAWLQFYSKTLNEIRSIQESGLRAVLRHVLSPVRQADSDRTRDAIAVYSRVANFLARQSEPEQITLESQNDFKRRYENDPNLMTIVDNLDDVERSIEQAMVPINMFLETITKLLSRGKSLNLANNELQILLADGQTLSIAHLSSGEKHLIKMLLSSMTAGPNSILIDEPELSMHLDWQRQFVDTILSLNPKCQLIIASHSPEVMAEVPDSSIFKL